MPRKPNNETTAGLFDKEAQKPKSTRTKKQNLTATQETKPLKDVPKKAKSSVVQETPKKVVAYARISTDTQEQLGQRHDIETYAKKENLTIDKWIEVEMSSRKSQELRRINELKQELHKGDLLLVAELTRLGRSMVEVMNLVEYFNQSGVSVCFVRQPELNTYNNALGGLLIAIYGYIAQAEREMISIRTKSALAAKKAEGQHLGRAKGTFNKKHPLDPFKDTIRLYREKGLNITAIHKLIDCPKKPHITNFIKYCKSRGLK
ncbi:recombinase family protein [Helicobacter felis]|uniref:recombinase family protein n=1 Tax=Helicobacter felis TaxID=214 RepID=UPI000CF1C6EF|nr:recombinase family protein [Helicobacter felis]